MNRKKAIKTHKIYRDTKFNVILKDNNILKKELVEYSNANKNELGFVISHPILSAVINHKRNVTVTSVYKALKLLNAYTGKEYTFNDIFPDISEIKFVFDE